MNQALFDLIIKDRSYRKRRISVEELSLSYSAEGLSPIERQTRRFEKLCSLEEPYFLPGERLCFLRTTAHVPKIFTPEECTREQRSHYVHEAGVYTNLTIDYEKVLKKGLLPLMEEANPYTLRVFHALLGLVDRYRQSAEERGLFEIAESLKQVPAHGARSFREALQSIRILNFFLWLEGNTHNTLGRFDQYLMPYLQNDLNKGILDRDGALDLVEEFFLSLNRDNDLYPGVQQGDNGQSLMLAGQIKNGTYGFNLLSELCLEASRNLKLIDPKINIRVDHNTPEAVFTLCSELTKAGLGFPQYSNDDVVIPALIQWGYAPEDAIDYTVAACWEFIIPGIGCDIPNIKALNIPGIINTCLNRDLRGCKSMEEFKAAIREEFFSQCDAICEKIGTVEFIPSPLLERLMAFEKGFPKYRNFGMHGVGLSTAADSLAAIEELVFGGTISAERLINGVNTDFAKDPELLHWLRYESPKLGCNSKTADQALCFLTDTFADALAGRTNCFGGCWRPGSGSAMYYLWMADECGATPDGRRAGEPFSANYSISLFARPEGPFSILQSMTTPDLKKICNGGPLTLEFHSAMFQTEGATRQLGQFVKKFIEMGGHQLQLNAVDAKTLKDAQVHPEQYPRLIVRIWGWSAYFTELDQNFQDHVIARQEYSL